MQPTGVFGTGTTAPTVPPSTQGWVKAPGSPKKLNFPLESMCKPVSAVRPALRMALQAVPAAVGLVAQGMVIGWPPCKVAAQLTLQPPSTTLANPPAPDMKRLPLP